MLKLATIMILVSLQFYSSYDEQLTNMSEFKNLLSEISNTIDSFVPSPQKICLQLPDSLFNHIPELYVTLTTNYPKKSCYFLADSTFGTNDPDAIAAQHINADLLVFVTLESVYNTKSALQHIKFIYWKDEHVNEDKTISSKHELTDLDIMKRYNMVEKLKIADIIGILIGTFSVERYKEAIDYATKLIKNEDKRPVICFMGEITPQKLCNLPEVDVWVQICEPSSIIKDQSDFYQPITSLQEGLKFLRADILHAEFNHLCSPARELAVAFDNLDFLNKHTDFNQILPEGYEPQQRLEALQILEDNSDLDDNSEDETTLLPAIVKSNKQISVRGKGGELVTKSAVSNYLAERTWRGVEIGAGKSEPAKLTQGLDGYAAAYKKETDE